MKQSLARNTFMGLLIVGLLICRAAAAGPPTGSNRGDAAEEPPEKIFIVNGYNYLPGISGRDLDLGHALCGTRCNALAADYRNYIEPRGWRIIKVASDKEMPVDLNNPFMDGSCICVVDEYVVKVNELYMSK